MRKVTKLTKIKSLRILTVDEDTDQQEWSMWLGENKLMKAL